MSGGVVNSMGAILPAAAIVGSGVAVIRAGRRERAVRQRLALLLCDEPDGRRRRLIARIGALRGDGPGGALQSGLLSAGAGLAGFMLVGGATGCGVGLVAAFGIRRWWRSRLAAAGDAEDSARIARQLPLAADLLAACLEAGAGPPDAAEAVGRSLGGPVGERLTQVAAELRLGGEPACAWGRLGELPGASGLARLLERAQAMGVPAVEPVIRLAADRRAGEARAAMSRARRAGVFATAPLGLCFLPAFLVVGVAPVLMGLASGLLNRR